MAAFLGIEAFRVGAPRLDLLRTRGGRMLADRHVLFAIRLLSVALFVLLLAAGFFGRQDDAFANILPTTVWVIWWVGLAFFSALVGNVWALVNPWTIIADWVAVLHRRWRPEQASQRPPPPGPEVWLAVVLFLAFAWAELVWSARSVPASLAFAITVYSVVTWLGMARYGRAEWLRRGEAFSVLFGLFARFSPMDARAGGGDPDAARQWSLRPYAVGLITEAPVPLSLMAFVILVLSTVMFDGLAETFAWQDLVSVALSVPALETAAVVLGFSNPASLLLTVGLVVVPLVFLADYLAVSWLVAAVVAAASRDGSSALVVARLFITSLIPIAIAYHLAHFLSLLLIFGQLIIPLASDPFGFGWDLFGSADYEIDIAIVDARFVWITSIIAIVVGHVAAVYIAHMVALGTFGDRRVALRSQYPMLVFMVGYTMVCLWILSQPIVE